MLHISFFKISVREAPRTQKSTRALALTALVRLWLLSAYVRAGCRIGQMGFYCRQQQALFYHHFVPWVQGTVAKIGPANQNGCIIRSVSNLADEEKF
jgi:hypothetical protein